MKAKEIKLEIIELDFERDPEGLIPIIHDFTVELNGKIALTRTQLEDLLEQAEELARESALRKIKAKEEYGTDKEKYYHG